MIIHLYATMHLSILTNCFQPGEFKLSIKYASEDHSGFKTDGIKLFKMCHWEYLGFILCVNLPMPQRSQS